MKLNPALDSVDGVDRDRQLAAVLEGKHCPLAREQTLRVAKAVLGEMGDRPQAAAYRRQVPSVLQH